MKIAIIGSGNIGSTLGRALVGVGHVVAFSARDVAELRPLVAELGANASAASAEQALEGADAVIVAVPYGAWPQLVRQLGSRLVGKLVIDAANPYPDRDGEMARAALARGSALATAELLPSTHVAKAFNTLFWKDLAEKGRQGIAIAFAADAPEAVEITRSLIGHVGFVPVLAGGLSEAWRFDPGQPAYGTAMSAEALRTALYAATFPHGESA